MIDFSCLNKQTDLKWHHNYFVFYWETLSSFRLCSGDLNVLGEQLVYSVMDRIITSLIL